MNYYENQKEHILRKDLFSDYAEEIAKKLGQVESFTPRNSNRSRRRKNSGSQVRKFYDEVIKIRIKLNIEIQQKEDRDKKFARELPYIRMMSAKAAYALEREKITTDFKNFIDENVKSINSFEDFEIFCDLFEAVIAYSKQYLKDL